MVELLLLRTRPFCNSERGSDAFSQANTKLMHCQIFKYENEFDILLDS